MSKPNKPYKHYKDLSFPLNVKICQSKEVNAAKTPPLQLMLYNFLDIYVMGNTVKP